MQVIAFTGSDIDAYSEIELLFDGQILKEVKVVLARHGNAVIITCSESTDAPFNEQCFETAFTIAKHLLETYSFDVSTYNE